MFLTGKDLLITGGTGSFGHEFVKTALEQHASRITVFSRDEYKQYQMAKKFPRSEYPSLRYRLGDVRDYCRLVEAMDGVDYVVHAAALKQVPAVEYNPFEATQTNIIGTQSVIRAAIERGVDKVVLVSSDKAVNPVNLYGATKMVAERLMISGNIMSAQKTKCAVVRYGNVWASRGSVIEVFEDRISRGQELLVTDPNMTRFMITLKEGVDLVCTALEMLQGGEVFVPMLPAYSIARLAMAMTAGTCISGDPFRNVGARIGEKVHESLYTTEEASRVCGAANGHKQFLVIVPEHYWYTDEHRAYWNYRVDKIDPAIVSRFRTSSTTDQLGMEQLLEIISRWRGEQK